MYKPQAFTPNFNTESQYWKSGKHIVAGADEVGRGAFAGPVVASIVILSPQIVRDYSKINKPLINDSKKLSRVRREEASIWIKANSLSWAIGEASAKEINKIGIMSALHKAYRRALKKIAINHKVDILLTDAFYIPRLKSLPKTKQNPIIKGDTKSLSIAASSIIAKVYRDSIMSSLGTKPEYEAYQWSQNKGYGTLAHRKTILDIGMSNQHRIQYVDSFMAKRGLL